MNEVLDDEVETVKMFSCLLRPGGNMLHTVPLPEITQRELRVLRSIHGSDCTTELNPIGEKEIRVREHLLELAAKYRRDRVEQVFSVSLDDFDEWLESRRENREYQREESKALRAASLAQQAVATAATKPAAGAGREAFE